MVRAISHSLRSTCCKIQASQAILHWPILMEMDFQTSSRTIPRAEQDSLRAWGTAKFPRLRNLSRLGTLTWIWLPISMATAGLTCLPVAVAAMAAATYCNTTGAVTGTVFNDHDANGIQT